MKQARDLQKRKNSLTKEKTPLIEERDSLRDYLAQLRGSGRISAEGRVYAGVKMHIREAVLDVRNEFNKTTFVGEGGVVKATRFQDLDEDISVHRTT